MHHAFQALALDEHRGAFTPAIWYLEPKFKDKVNLKQCWFPGYHGEVGGGVAEPLGRSHLAIEDITLAWMCDQVDGLLTFDWNVSRNVLGEIRENVKWGVTREDDPSGGIWNLSVAGGRSLRRTPGSYHKKPNHKRWKSRREYTTNETIHPSVKLLVNVPEANYFPLGLDCGTTWKMLRIPRWNYIDKSDTGEGGFWTRSAVLGKPSITIKEHVVRERPDKINFEAKLLPVAVQDMLHRRNLAEYDKMYASSADYEESI